MKTRIRVEKSEHGEYYFPEYLKVKSRLFRKDKEEWRSIDRRYDEWWIYMVTDAMQKLEVKPKKYTEEWAKKIIDLSLLYRNDFQEFKQHQESKETSYVKYP